MAAKFDGDAYAMNTEKLMDMQRAEPFQPYRIHLADGRHRDVRHRDFVARDPGGRFAAVFEPDGRFELIDLMLVTSFEVLRNGTRRGRKPRSGKER